VRAKVLIEEPPPSSDEHAHQLALEGIIVELRLADERLQAPRVEGCDAPRDSRGISLGHANHRGVVIAGSPACGDEVLHVEVA